MVVGGGGEQGQAASTASEWWASWRKLAEARVWKVGEKGVGREEGPGAETRSWRAPGRFGELSRGGACSGSQEALQAACGNRLGEGRRQPGGWGGSLRPGRVRVLAEIRLGAEQLKRTGGVECN